MRNEHGQTLIEVLTGLAAAVVVTAAITVASLTSLQNAQFSRDQNLATNIAQQGLELIRNMRDTDIASIMDSTNLPDGNYCFAKTCTALTNTDNACWTKISSCNQNYDLFVRQVDIVHNDPSCDSSISNTKVSVIVSWYDTRCSNPTNQFCHNVTLSTCFSDFTVVPTP